MPDEPTTIQSAITGEIIRTVKQFGVALAGFWLAYFAYGKWDEAVQKQDASQEHHINSLQAEVVTLQQALKASATAIEMLRKP